MVKQLIVSCFLLSSLSPALSSNWTPKYQKTDRRKNIKKKELGQKKTDKQKQLKKGDFLLSKYKKKSSKKRELIALKSMTLKMGRQAVPLLIKVMKSEEYPDKKRWVATFLLGQIMGKRSASFIGKFIKHPNWVLRLASLKTLLALDMKKSASLFVKALKDKSLFVRNQALENIRLMRLKKFAPYVWRMLFDKKNYSVDKKGKRHRTFIIKNVIKTLGDLNFKKAQTPLLSMIKKKKYTDIFSELDYSLEKLTGKKSPQGDRVKKIIFWTQFTI